MEYDAQVYRLSNQFYSDYPDSNYPEILKKNHRSYTCLVIDTKIDYFICIPFRSNINHNEAFLFTNTRRSQRSRSGLDYKKTVLIKKYEYLDTNNTALVDNDEYSAVMSNLNKIVLDINEYIERYVGHITGKVPLHHREFERKYKFSTLPYFHDILGI